MSVTSWGARCTRALVLLIAGLCAASLFVLVLCVALMLLCVAMILGVSLYVTHPEAVRQALSGLAQKSTQWCDLVGRMGQAVLDVIAAQTREPRSAPADPSGS